MSLDTARVRLGGDVPIVGGVVFLLGLGFFALAGGWIHSVAYLIGCAGAGAAITSFWTNVLVPRLEAWFNATDDEEEVSG